MSPDDVFAGQMWTWPEPVIKRDSMGRVLFVNAAFLQLYGGTIDAWRGNAVQGWANPQPPGQCYRFETRQAAPQGEQVYDWVEYSMADGSAMTLARNITHFLAPADPPPGSQAPVPQGQAQTAQPESHSAPPEQPAQAAYAQGEPVSQATEATTTTPPEYTSDVFSGAEQVIAEKTTLPAADHAEPEPAANYSAPATEVQAEIAQAAPEQSYQAPPAPMAEPAMPAAQTQPTAPPAMDASIPAQPVANQAGAAPANPLNPEGRDFERRALPIEDGDAVLGNNWRDAVIAKAVGVEQFEAAAESEHAQAAAPEDGAGNGQDISKTRILLAEDNAINALLTRTLLEAEGCHVETVEDGLLAVEAVKNSSFDLIFMDMRMPNMDGLEATRKIRTLPNVSKDLPIIALTANAFDDDRNACFDSGMNDFMTKPVSAEELSEMVRNWTKQEEEAIAS